MYDRDRGAVRHQTKGNAQSADSAAIRDALAQTMDFPTILGNFSFDSNGEAVYAPIVLMVKDGELQLFE